MFVRPQSHAGMTLVRFSTLKCKKAARLVAFRWVAKVKEDHPLGGQTCVMLAPAWSHLSEVTPPPFV